MKGLILSGGAGTRLRPITHTSAKQLVPVANKPILFYGIEDMAEAGIVEIGIIVGDTRAEVMEAVGDGSAFGVKVTYIPQDEPLGLAHCVLIARDFLGDDDFVMYLGDNLLRQGIAEFVDAFEGARHEARAPGVAAGGPGVPSAQILLAHVDDPQRFGVAEIGPGGEVVRLVEKPEVPPSDLALVGVYLFDPEIHDAVAAIEPSARGELEITDAIQWLIDQGRRVRHQVVDGWWIDTGKLDPLLEGNRLVLETIEPRIEGSVDAASRVEGRVVVEEGAQLINSVVRGPSIIGRNTVVRDSYIGPYSAVYFDCSIVDSELEHTIVLESSSIEHVPRMQDSLIGKQVSVRRSERRPRATRLMLGDHSVVDLE
jgi:glucose-1-phosphate thymidylyltransferase